MASGGFGAAAGISAFLRMDPTDEEARNLLRGAKLPSVCTILVDVLQYVDNDAT